MPLSTLLLTALPIAQVDLVLEPTFQDAAVGSIVEVTLTAKASTVSSEDFTAIDAIVCWDPAELTLIDAIAGFPWFVSGFLPDPDGINDDVTDGLALYTALSEPATPATTPPDILVTTFRFTVLQDAVVKLVPSIGTFGRTRVLGTMPGQEITGDISATATIDSCPTTAATVFTYNGSGVNLDVLNATAAIVGGPWTATLSPQPTRAPGFWVLAVRLNQAAGPILDIGTIALGVSGGASELLIGAGVIADYPAGMHGGGGTTTPFTAPLPLACALVGLPWFSQAFLIGDLPAFPGDADPWFTTAVGGVVGSF